MLQSKHLLIVLPKNLGTTMRVKVGILKVVITSNITLVSYYLWCHLQIISLSLKLNTHTEHDVVDKRQYDQLFTFHIMQKSLKDVVFPENKGFFCASLDKSVC